MWGALRYSAANAVVRAAVGGFLTSEHWRQLLQAADLDDIAAVLHRTVYGEMLTRPLDSPQRFETRIRRYLAKRLHNPLKFLHGAAGELIEWDWRRFEVMNLMLLLRGIHSQIPAARIRESLVPLGDMSHIDWATLAGASSITSLVERLAAHPRSAGLAAPLEKALGEYERRNQIFVLETSLDLAYRRQLLDRLQELAGGDRRDAEDFAGFRIDCSNFLEACRYRLYFGMSPEDILGYTVPHGKRVTAARLQQIAMGAPPAEMAAAIWPDLPDLDRLEGRSDKEVLTILEVLLDRRIHAEALLSLRGEPLRLRIIFAHAVLLGHEADDIVAVAEGKILGRSIETIRGYLAGPRGQK